jgi:hypothetical protein
MSIGELFCQLATAKVEVTPLLRRPAAAKDALGRTQTLYIIVA